MAHIPLSKTWDVHNRGYLCPGCGSWHVVPAVADGARRHFCVACESCWEIHGSIAVKVDPLACEGCGREGQCYERLRDRVPTFVYGDRA